MARRRKTDGLPEMPEGLTIEDCARRLSARLDRHVTAAQVYYVAVRRGLARRLGRKRIPISRMDERLVLHPDELETIGEAVQDLYHAGDGHLDCPDSEEVD